MPFRALLIACILAVALPPPAQAQVDEVSCDGPLQDEQLRHPTTRVAPRFVRDLAAIPASVVAWDDADWARFGAFALPTTALMWPAGPSFDERAFRWVKNNTNPHAKRFFFKLETVPEGAFLAGYGALLFSSAWLSKNPRLFEYATLALETMGVVQFYHIATKLMIGRESPHQADGEPRIYGPTKFLFPGGTPSGHASTAWSQLFVFADYWSTYGGPWPVTLATSAVGIYLSTALVYRRQHYLSDVIAGAGMGLYMARWIVRHRSSRFRCKGSSRASLGDRLTVVPVIDSHTFLLALSLRL